MSDTPDLSIRPCGATETEFMRRWEDAVHAMDVPAIQAMLADDVVFNSPAVYRPYKGKTMVAFILGLVAEVMPDLHYTNAYANGRSGIVLLFEASTTTAEGKTRGVQGIDLFEIDGEGRVKSLTVMIRPLSSLMAVADRMKALFAQKMPGS